MQQGDIHEPKFDNLATWEISNIQYLFVVQLRYLRDSIHHAGRVASNSDPLQKIKSITTVEMEAKRGAAVSESELNVASKGLHTTKGTREHSDSLEFDPQVAEQLETLYEKFDGDIKAIFKELDENPRKALKHPPTSAAEFGKKYAQGFYTMAEAK